MGKNWKTPFFVICHERSDQSYAETSAHRTGLSTLPADSRTSRPLIPAEQRCTVPSKALCAQETSPHLPLYQHCHLQPPVRILSALSSWTHFRLWDACSAAKHHYPFFSKSSFAFLALFSLWVYIWRRTRKGLAWRFVVPIPCLWSGLQKVVYIIYKEQGGEMVWYVVSFKLNVVGLTGGDRNRQRFESKGISCTVEMITTWCTERKKILAARAASRDDINMSWSVSLYARQVI